MKVPDTAPHSIAFWFKWEIQDRKMNGQLSGCPKDSKEYRGVLNCKDRDEAKQIIKSIVNNFTKDVEQCHNQLEANKNVVQQVL